MARIKWELTILNIILVKVLVYSLPLDNIVISSSLTTDPIFKHSDTPIIPELVESFLNINNFKDKTELSNVTKREKVTKISTTGRNAISQIRPGQSIQQYALEITIDGNVFNVRAVLTVVLTFETSNIPITLSVENLDIQSVSAGIYSETNAMDAEFEEDNGILRITPAQLASTYIVIINYSGSLTGAGQGLYRGSFNNVNYLAMNLYPTNARRVFPCMDELTQPSLISFTFHNIEYENMVMNSVPVANRPTDFMALQGPPLLWSMVAHNLVNIVDPVDDVLLYIRPGVTNQETVASVAIQYFFENLNDWTNMPYFGIVLNQNPQLQILALPDVARDWYGLSSVALWEPYVLMENSCSVKQRFAALSKIAEALARQWFGYVIYPENFRYQWIVSGLATYAGFDVLREFQLNTIGNEMNILDINTLFVTDVIQESLLKDGYIHATVTEPNENLYNENIIRDHLNGIVKYKAPAILRMLRLVIGGATDDLIQPAGSTLIARRSFDTVNTVQFINVLDDVSSEYSLINITEQYLEPFIQNNGYPVLNVQKRPGGVSLSLEWFRYQQSTGSNNYVIPLTYTFSNAPNYVDTIYPVRMLEGSLDLDFTFEEGDDDDDDAYIIFNIQGQGYYRVNYDNVLWERIINALQDPSQRAQIHPLNRATLLDDALNLARGGRLAYETAFRVALTWEHETEYAPWKAFVRNMDFLRKRLVAMVTEENLDQDIYLRMLTLTLGSFEADIEFSPDPQIFEPALRSLTRGLVMDHACRAYYQPCIAAALDWFYGSNSNVNPNIPKDIRPAVYCTMVREGGNDAITALNARLAIEPSMWERVVILESLACSRDTNYINSLLTGTIATNSQYTTEERIKIFIAVVESSFENAQTALGFLNLQANAIRNMYGGDERLEEVIHELAENMASPVVTQRFINVVNSQTSNNLNDAQFSANRAAQIARENWNWETRHLQEVYDWIEENNAPNLMVSFALMIISCVVALIIQKSKIMWMTSYYISECNSDVN